MTLNSVHKQSKTVLFSEETMSNKANRFELFCIIEKYIQISDLRHKYLNYISAFIIAFSIQKSIQSYCRFSKNKEDERLFLRVYLLL